MTFRYIFIALILVILLGSCSEESRENGAPANTDDTLKVEMDAHDNGNQDTRLRDKADIVMLLLKEKEWRQLAKYVHPIKGLLFSPYGYIDTGEVVVFSQKEIVELEGNGKIYTWGTYDGSGNPIASTFQEYYKKFIYDADFLNADTVAVGQIIQSGNTLINIREVFPEARLVSYHFPMFEEQYEGMDWKSLRLVFEEYQEEWRLVAIVHGQWTI